MAEPQDRARVNMNEEWEVNYWRKEFGCTRHELRTAVKAVCTTSVEKVREYLKGKR